ncbi:hypothetical protein CsatA_024316 [Cannabis sativa]
MDMAFSSSPLLFEDWNFVLEQICPRWSEDTDLHNGMSLQMVLIVHKRNGGEMNCRKMIRPKKNQSFRSLILPFQQIGVVKNFREWLDSAHNTQPNITTGRDC